jgi:excisionase family DNA binding protein
MTSRTISRDRGPGSTPATARTPTPPQADKPGAGQAERLAYSVHKAARLTGLSRDLLYDEMRRGNLAYLKVGRRRPIIRKHLEQFLGITRQCRGLRSTTASTRREGPGAPY